VISKTVLVLAEAFGEGLSAERVAAALALGLEADGHLDCDLFPLEAPANAESAARGSAASAAPESQPAGRAGRASAVSAALDEHSFDARMRAARALVIVRERLDDRTLLADRRSRRVPRMGYRSSIGSVAFEAATRARQSGVPAYAVTAHDELDPFEARIVDLQVVIEARTTRALRAAGVELAKLA
jgi:hypothetical protein